MPCWLIIKITIEELYAMNRMHDPAHPGEVLREFLPSEMSVGEVALRLGGVSRPHLSIEWTQFLNRQNGHQDRLAYQHHPRILVGQPDELGFVADIGEATPHSGCATNLWVKISGGDPAFPKVFPPVALETTSERDNTIRAFVRPMHA